LGGSKNSFSNSLSFWEGWGEAIKEQFLELPIAIQRVKKTL